MEHAEHRFSVALWIRDPILLEICTAELLAMRADPVSVTDPVKNGTADLPTVIDLDALPDLSPDRLPAYCLGISRREAELSPALSARCKGILHRPFPLDSLRTAITALQQSQTAEKAQKTAPGVKSRRMTARHAKRKHVPLSPSPSGLSILCEDTEIPLTPAEMTVFLALRRANGETVTRETLCKLLDAKDGSNLPDVHICAIRKKLIPYGKDALIHTVRGIGYRLLIS